MSDSNHPEPTHIELGSYTADVLHRTSAEPFWYYVVLRKESSAVIDLARFDTYEQAIAGAREMLVKLNQAAASG